MKVLPYFFCLLLSASTLVDAQTLPSETGASANRPLNLSARKPVPPVSDASVIWPPQPPDAGAALPYGTGFENRQQGSNAGSGNTGSGGSGSGSGGGGSSGNGGGGRGGSGRGR